MPAGAATRAGSRSPCLHEEYGQCLTLSRQPQLCPQLQPGPADCHALVVLVELCQSDLPIPVCICLAELVLHKGVQVCLLDAVLQGQGPANVSDPGDCGGPLYLLLSCGAWASMWRAWREGILKGWTPLAGTARTGLLVGWQRELLGSSSFAEGPPLVRGH